MSGLQHDIAGIYTTSGQDLRHRRLARRASYAVAVIGHLMLGLGFTILLAGAIKGRLAVMVIGQVLVLTSTLATPARRYLVWQAGRFQLDR